MLTLCFCFCLCLVCFESRRQPLRLVEAWDSLVVKKVRNSLTWFSHGSGAASALVPLGRVSFST